MSATNRSQVRRKDDDYATPPWCVKAIAPYVVSDAEQTILDPCAGSGTILSTIKSMAPWVLTRGIELDPARAHVCSMAQHDVDVGDALDGRRWPEAGLIITNPPYSLAMSFLCQALMRRQSTTVAFLLRLNFLGSQKRSKFWRNHPCDVYVLSKRPSFAMGGTDATEYAWFVFRPDGPEHGRWQVLE